jgi:hypothetical protein
MDLPVSMNGRFQVPPAAGQLLPSARTADPSEDGEIFDSDDDDDRPSVKQILASSKRANRVIDLTGDDDDDREGDDGDFIEVSWLRTTRSARQLVRLILPSLIVTGTKELALSTSKAASPATIEAPTTV